MDQIEAAWLAGLIEGEGCIRRSSNGHSAVLSVAMCDKEPLERAARIVGAGNVTGPYQPKNKTHRPHYQWNLSQRPKLKEIFENIYPWLSPRRQEAVDSIRNIFESPRKHRWGVLDS